jgi:hypothetical protein
MNHSCQPKRTKRASSLGKCDIRKNAPGSGASDGDEAFTSLTSKTEKLSASESENSSGKYGTAEFSNPFRSGLAAGNRKQSQ